MGWANFFKERNDYFLDNGKEAFEEKYKHEAFEEKYKHYKNVFYPSQSNYNKVLKEDNLNNEKVFEQMSFEDYNKEQ